MNTKNESSGSAPAQLDLETEANESEVSSKIDETVDSLSKQLEAAKDGRREERFIWLMVCVILVDVLWFRNAPNPTFPIVILLLEAVVLFILANRMGVEEAKGLFERLLQSIAKTGQ